MKKILLLLIAITLSGCTALDRYERTYTASVDADSQTGFVSVTLKPISAPATLPPVPQPGVVDEATLKKIIELLSKNTQPVTILDTPTLSEK